MSCLSAHSHRVLLASFAAVGLLVAPAPAANPEAGESGDEHQTMQKMQKSNATDRKQAGKQPSATAKQPDPYAQPDRTWISLSGTVQTVTRDAFTLDYGNGLITVEMDDGDRDADAYKLVAGDEVTVNGRIDDDFFETTTIEASSVFVKKLGTYFYASAVDEEDAFGALTPTVPLTTSVQGWVTSVNGDEFTLDTGVRMLTVDVENLPYDPLDDEGYQKIEVGDRVRVTGRMQDDFFEGRELSADVVIEISG